MSESDKNRNICIFNVAAILYAIIYRPNFDNFTSELGSRHIYVHDLLIKVSR